MPRGPSPAVLLPVLFFVSGATALAGQVVLNRLLGYVFGASHLATATVLAAYMAGLALGALLVGRLAARMRRPVAVYALLELGVAAFFALVPTTYPLIQAAGVQAGRVLSVHPVAFGVIRFSLAFGYVLVPTVLMGGTLPALVTAFGGDSLRRSLPRLYALNTLGGAAGALLSGYVLAYAFGLDGTLYACAGTNALVGALALAAATAAPARGAGVRQDLEPPPGHEGGASAQGLTPRAVCALAFAQGTLSFSLEVLWSHVIRTVIGVTTYAFTVMLTVVLLGIGLGSGALGLFGRRGHSPLRQFVLAQLLLAASLAASLFLWDRFPDYVAATLRWRYEWSFSERELLRFLFAVPLLLPAGAALGLALPALTAAVRGVGAGAGESGAWVGRVFAYNTVGAICGSLFTGFVLLGRVPSASLMRATVLGALALAAAPLLFAERPRHAPGRRELAGATAVLAAVALFPGWDMQRLTSGKHFMWDFQGLSEPLVFLREDAQSGFVTVERESSGRRVMKTNGKYEGTDAEVEFQDNFALIGALYLRRFERAAVLGLGPGRTLALLHEMPFRRIEAMEFSPAIVAAARAEFARVSGDALADSARVRLVLDDGRNHLQLSRGAYDYIVVGITAAAFAGAGGIYNRDFFALARTRLAEDGIFVMWIQTHHILPEDVRSVVFSMRDAFPHVHLYAVPEGQAFVVASASPLRIDPAVADRLGRGARAARILEARGHASAVELVVWNVIGREEDLHGYFRSASLTSPPFLYTDMRPRFEFTAPMGLATRILKYDFAPFASPGLPEFAPPLPPADAQRLARWRNQTLGRATAQSAGASAGQTAPSSAAN